MSANPSNPFFAPMSNGVRQVLDRINYNADRLEYKPGQGPDQLQVAGYDANDNRLFQAVINLHSVDLRRYQTIYIPKTALVIDTLDLTSLLTLLDNDNPPFANASTIEAPTALDLAPDGVTLSWAAAWDWFDMTADGTDVYLTPKVGLPSTVMTGQLNFKLLPSDSPEYNTIMLLHGPGFYRELLPAITPPQGIVYLNYQAGTGEVDSRGVVTAPAHRLSPAVRYMACSTDVDGDDICKLHDIDTSASYLIVRSSGRTSDYSLHIVNEDGPMLAADVVPNADGSATTIIAGGAAGVISVGFEGEGGAFPVTIEHVYGSYLTSANLDDPVEIDSAGRLKLTGEEALVFEQTFDTTAGMLCQMTIGTDLPAGEFDGRLLGMYSDDAYLMLRYTGGQYTLSVTDTPEGGTDRLNATVRVTAPFGASERLAFGIDTGNNLWMEYHDVNDAVYADHRPLTHASARRARVNLEIDGEQPFHIESFRFVNRAAPWS